MSRKLIVFLFLIIFFSKFNLVRADVVINEVQVLPTGEKFFELYNTGDLQVDLTGWYIKKKTESGTESSLVVAGRLENKLISAGGYFLIANETGYTGSASMNASWPPSNTGVASNNTLIIYDSNGAEVDKVGWGEASDCPSPCPANPPSGQSIQKNGSGSWIVATPTPGTLNEEIVVNENTESNNSNNESTDTGGSGSTNSSSSNSSNSSSSSSSSSRNRSTIKKPTEPKVVKTKIITPKAAFVGIPFDLKSEVFNTVGETFNAGRYFWNFGDGNSKEVKDGTNFPYTYFYEGEYVISLEYYSKNSSQTPKAVAETTIKVVPVDVSISRVGSADDFFIELSNNTNYEINISGWRLLSLDKIFVFPKNSILLSKKKIILPPVVTNFLFTDVKSLKLNTISGQLVFDYNNSSLPLLEPAIPSQESDLPAQTSEISSASYTRDETDKENRENNKEESVLGEDLVASSSRGNTYLPLLASVLLIFGSAGAVYFIRQKKIMKQPGDDFYILE